MEPLEDDGACTHIGTTLVRLTGTVWRCQCAALVAIEPEEVPPAPTEGERDAVDVA